MFNVIEILNRYGIEYKKDSYTSEVNILCPFHNDHNFGSAKINEETGLFNCFSCGKGGNIYQFVALLEGIEDNEAYKLVANNFSNSKIYDLSKLEERRIHTQKKQGDLANKIVNNILNRLLPIQNIDIKHRWLVMCTHIKYNVNELKDKQLLEIYSEFNKESI